MRSLCLGGSVRVHIVSTAYQCEAVTQAQLEVRRMTVPCCRCSINLADVISLHHSVTFVIIVAMCKCTNFSSWPFAISLWDRSGSNRLTKDFIYSFICNKMLYLNVYQDESGSKACIISLLHTYEQFYDHSMCLGDDVDIASQLRTGTVRTQHYLLVHHAGKSQMFSIQSSDNFINNFV